MRGFISRLRGNQSDEYGIFGNRGRVDHRRFAATKVRELSHSAFLCLIFLPWLLLNQFAMKQFISFMFLTLSTVYAPAQGFAGFPEYLLSLPEAGRQARVDSFLGANPVSPLTPEIPYAIFYTPGRHKVFFWRAMPPNGPRPCTTKVDGTNFWHLTLSYEQMQDSIISLWSTAATGY